LAECWNITKNSSIRDGQQIVFPVTLPDVKPIHAFVAALLVLPLHAEKEDGKDKSLTLDEILFDESVWTKTLEEIKGPEEKEDDEDEDEDDKLTKELREKLRKRGIEFTDDEDEEGFAWLSAAKDGLRAEPEEFELLDREVGEVVIRGRDGKAIDATISLFNRGDDGVIPLTDFNEKLHEWKSLLDEKLAVRSETRNQRGAVALQGWMWRKGDTAVLLEGSVNRSENRAEFIRLRFASISAAKAAPSGMARRGTFVENVKKDDKGFTWIDGVPMVDQGQKGYCVVATVERVARYFGADVDQHEMAQLANTDEDGTHGDEMEKAFQKVTGKIHLRTLKHIEYDERQMEKDIRNYNSAAKKIGVKTFDLDPDEWHIDPRHFWSVAHKETFRDVKRGQAKHDHFTRKIKEYIDQGIPLCWTLYLGMFKEDDLPQTYGGHMRLIIGYNFTSPDSAEHEIYFTDSWGEGHEKKIMRADEAFCMTMALYTMLPNK
jgi:hypothetical protein